MTEKIQAIVELFNKARSEEMSIRGELETIADGLRTLSHNREVCDAGISAGVKFPDELREIDQQISALKKKRDQISTRLQTATDKVRRTETESILPISKALISKFNEVRAAEEILRSRAAELQEIAGLLDKKRWIWNRELSPIRRSPLAAYGLPEIFKENELDYYQKLMEGIDD
jgi:DNA repair exonuclease SbcCD ATPase subunit